MPRGVKGSKSVNGDLRKGHKEIRFVPIQTNGLTVSVCGFVVAIAALFLGHECVAGGVATGALAIGAAFAAQGPKS